MVLILTADQRYVPRVTKPPSYSLAVPVIHYAVKSEASKVNGNGKGKG